MYFFGFKMVFFAKCLSDEFQFRKIFHIFIAFNYCFRYL